MITATHISLEKYNTPWKVVYRAMKAMSDIMEGISQGTFKNPAELASSKVRIDGEEMILVEAIYKNGYVMYNDGWYIVEVDDSFMYVDLTALAVSEEKRHGMKEYQIICDCYGEEEEAEMEAQGLKLAKNRWRVIV